LGTSQDEALKAAAHGLVLGSILIPLAYNIRIKKWRNIFIYTALAGFEIFNIVEHVKDSDVCIG